MPLSRPKKRRAYPEGTVFAVPLRGGGYAVGLVARVGRRGTTLGYFFGPRREKVPVLSEVAELNPEAALLVELFGDLGLMEGHWPIIGLASSFDRRRWPLPPFGRIEEFTGRAFRVEYDEDHLPEVLREVQISPSEAKLLPGDGLAGAGFMEISLTRMLARESSSVGASVTRKTN